MLKKCKTHNLQQNMICTGEICHKRVGCELCIHKHDHKFYLDTKSKQLKIQKAQKQLNQKIINLKKYIKSNINSLKLHKYKELIQQSFEEEILFLKNKFRQERQNFLLWIQKSQKFVLETISELQQSILENWQKYHQKSVQYLNTEKQYEELRVFFLQGDWSGHEHVQKSLNFLYSEQSLFKFNRNMDNLKKIIHHHKKQNNYVFTWLNTIRDKFSQYQLCPEHTFKGFIKEYQTKPQLMSCEFNQTKQSRDNEDSVYSMIGGDRRALLIYPKQIYQPFQHVYKLKRLNNVLFATTGARSLNIWTKTNLQAEKIYQLDYTSYGLSTFVEKDQDQSNIILFGKSNGEIGQLNMKNSKIKYVKGHQGAIRDIIQFDQYHFLTASQDWLIKVWGMNDKNDVKFAGQRAVLKGHSGKLHCLCKFGPNVLAGGADGSIRLWDIQSESFDEVFEHEKEIYTLTEIRPQLFLSGGQLLQMNLFDYRTPKSPAIKYPIQNCCNSSLRYNEHSFLFSDRNIVKLVDIRKYKEPLLRYVNKDTYKHAINDMDFLSDIELGMGGNDCFVTIWKY